MVIAVTPELEDGWAKRYGMPDDWREQGFDTTEVIEHLYDRTPTGAIMCCWPRCNFKRKDPFTMFLHVHKPWHPRRGSPEQLRNTTQV